MDCSVKLQLGSAFKAMKMTELPHPKKDTTLNLQLLDFKCVKKNPPNSSPFLLKGKVLTRNSVIQEIKTASSLKPTSFLIFSAKAEHILKVWKGT